MEHLRSKWRESLGRFPRLVKKKRFAFRVGNRNRGNGISEIEGKAARVAASESGDERVSNQEAELGFRAVVSAVPSGSGPGNDCAEDSARYNRGFFSQAFDTNASTMSRVRFLIRRFLESGKKEPRKIPAFLLSLLNIASFLVRRRGNGRLSSCCRWGCSSVARK